MSCKIYTLYVGITCITKSIKEWNIQIVFLSILSGRNMTIGVKLHLHVRQETNEVVPIALFTWSRGKKEVHMFPYGDAGELLKIVSHKEHQHIYDFIFCKCFDTY